ncbi:hypothetical protein NG791_28625, partial [Laspinema sp. D1]|uniref:hypothetical protein n=1 Tax=Laspinema palackyanum TaxID=3231601 RepID=UPI00347E81DB|nr:hypothetical protein [Laspinema sp. D2b]
VVTTNPETTEVVTTNPETTEVVTTNNSERLKSWVNQPIILNLIISRSTLYRGKLGGVGGEI